MEEIKEVGFYEEKEGHKSFARLNISWYFWGICLPGSLWILYVIGDMALTREMDISSGGILAGFFIVLQLGWIAPKTLSKINEMTGMINSLKK